MVKLTVAPSGRVSAATVTGKFAGTPSGSCVESAVKSAKFAPSAGPDLRLPRPAALMSDARRGARAACARRWARSGCTSSCRSARPASIGPGVRPAAGALLPGPAAAVVVGDGGGAFFAGFQATAPATRPSSDRQSPGSTTPRASSAGGRRAGAGAAGASTWRSRSPEEHRRWLPFQRLGQVAGLPPPGPLGVQVHPRFGPWWGYRALIVVARSAGRRAAAVAPCARLCCPLRGCLSRRCAGRARAWTSTAAPATVWRSEACAAPLRLPASPASRPRAPLSRRPAGLPHGRPRCARIRRHYGR